MNTYACGVGSPLEGAFCTGSSGAQTVSTQNTFIRLGLPGDTVPLAILIVELGTPSSDVQLNPGFAPGWADLGTPSGEAVFLPPSCGGGEPLTCPSTLAAVTTRIRRALLTNTATKSVTYYWRQEFVGHNVFRVMRKGRVVSHTKVSGTPTVLHAHRWFCPRTGKFVLQVRGRTNNGVWRGMRKRVVLCP